MAKLNDKVPLKGAKRATAVITKRRKLREMTSLAQDQLTLDLGGKLRGKGRGKMVRRAHSLLGERASIGRRVRRRARPFYLPHRPRPANISKLKKALAIVDSNVHPFSRVWPSFFLVAVPLIDESNCKIESQSHSAPKKVKIERFNYPPSQTAATWTTAKHHTARKHKLGKQTLPKYVQFENKRKMNNEPHGAGQGIYLGSKTSICHLPRRWQ